MSECPWKRGEIVDPARLVPFARCSGVADKGFPYERCKPGSDEPVLHAPPRLRARLPAGAGLGHAAIARLCTCDSQHAMLVSTAATRHHVSVI